jgi:hypothetical protein
MYQGKENSILPVKEPPGNRCGNIVFAEGFAG